MRTETLAKLACAFSGLVWGLFWLPVRELAAAGIEGLWANLLFYGVPFAIVLPLAVRRFAPIRGQGLKLQALGLSIAAALMLYSLAMLNTEVVRGMLLFYLTPFWSLVLAWLVLGEKIRPPHWFAMAIAALGLGIILRVDSGFDAYLNAGDVMALASGMIWAVAAVLLRASPQTPAIDITVMNFIWCGLVAAAAPLIVYGGTASSPPLHLYLAQLAWLVPVSIIVVMSGVYAGMWGARHLNPGIVGLLFMTEISVGAVTAALWAGEPFGWREVAGIVLITCAGLLDTIWDWAAARRVAVRSQG